ncbi:hypothetical protein DZD18_02575 [Rhodobacteraceae bacterium W635]|uniref:hypothetical protein n=1 Tax=Nioella halotolerans TaxID=2303578 RepID=UPI000E3DC6C4|nr:hypothetical protein DZD18_02575 [Rhodobacteraceae bacterium W635]
MDPFDLVLPLAVFAGIYAVVTGLSWLRRYVGESLAGRKTAMRLNLARRAGPPILAALILLVAGGVIGVAGEGELAALLAGGGLSFGFHRGLAELNRPDWRELALRGALTLAFGLFLLWQIGVL